MGVEGVHITVCQAALYHYGKNPRSSLYKQKGCFGLTVLEVLVYNPLIQVLLEL